MTTENNTPDATVQNDSGAPDAAALAAASGNPGAPAGEPVKAPPAEPVKLDVAADEADAKGAIAYNPTGDRGLDMALEYVGKHGFGPDHPSMVPAIESGNFDLLKVELIAKGLPAHEVEVYLTLAGKAYEKFSAETRTKQAADKAAVEKIAGGAEQWTAVTEYVKANADESETKALQGLLSKGGKEAEIAASFMVNAYARANGDPSVQETDGAGARVSNSNGAGAASNNALSPSEYGLAVAEARRTHSNRTGAFEDSKVYNDLKARRLRYKG
jgi:hypothetical protein